MDNSSNEDKETCLRPKKLKTYDANKDYINDLPDPILVHILSFLPLRDAVRTVLLRRFGKLWLSMPVLDLDNCVYRENEGDDDVEICDYEKFMDIIHQVWNHRDENILDQLHLRFWFPITYSNSESALDRLNVGDFERRELEKEKAAAYQIEKLVCYAINRKVKILALNFKGCGYNLAPLKELYKLPNVFSSNYLTELRLAACDISSCGEIDLQALRVLFLNKVILSDKAMVRILRGCPFLEDLSLVDCYGLGKLKSGNPNLKKVRLSLDAEKKQFFISCPHVVSLEISGWIERPNLFDVSSLVDASICFNILFKCEQRLYVDVLTLLLKIHHCKTFSPCGWSILVMSIWKLKNIPVLRFDWKHINLELGVTKWHIPGLFYLLKGSSSSLETLTMRTVDFKDSYFQREEAKWILEYDFDGEKYWDSQEAKFPCLENITIYGRINSPYVIQMVKFLLKNAPMLRKMVISTEKCLEVSLSREFLTFPIASSQASIHFS